MAKFIIEMNLTKEEIRLLANCPDDWNHLDAKCRAEDMMKIYLWDFIEDKKKRKTLEGKFSLPSKEVLNKIT